MFDVGFSELMMLGLVALLVIGPERLPKAARIAGYWLGKARSTIANVQAEIKHELHAEEMRQLMQENSILDEFHQTSKDVKTTLQSLEHTPEPPEPAKTDHDKSA